MYLMGRHYMLMVVRYIVLWALTCGFWAPQMWLQTNPLMEKRRHKTTRFTILTYYNPMNHDVHIIRLYQLLRFPSLPIPNLNKLTRHH